MKLSVDVPDEWADPIEKAMKMERWKKFSPYIRELIKKDLTSKGLLGVKNGEGEVEVTA